MDSGNLCGTIRIGAFRDPGKVRREVAALGHFDRDVRAATMSTFTISEIVAPQLGLVLGTVPCLVR